MPKVDWAQLMSDALAIALDAKNLTAHEYEDQVDSLMLELGKNLNIVDASPKEIYEELMKVLNP